MDKCRHTVTCTADNAAFFAAVHNSLVILFFGDFSAHIKGNTANRSSQYRQFQIEPQNRTADFRITHIMDKAHIDVYIFQ